MHNQSMFDILVLHLKKNINFIEWEDAERISRMPEITAWLNWIPRLGLLSPGFAFLPLSSIGMAKAALECINGANLFGLTGAGCSVMFIDIDAHYRDRTTFDTILPRESASKVTVYSGDTGQCDDGFVSIKSLVMVGQHLFCWKTKASLKRPYQYICWKASSVLGHQVVLRCYTRDDLFNTDE